MTSVFQTRGAWWINRQWHCLFPSRFLLNTDGGTNDWIMWLQAESFLIHWAAQSPGEAPLKELRKDRCFWEEQHQHQLYPWSAPGLCLQLLWELPTPLTLCPSPNYWLWFHISLKRRKLKTHEHCVYFSYLRRNHPKKKKPLYTFNVHTWHGSSVSECNKHQHSIRSSQGRFLSQLQCCKYKLRVDVISVSCSTFTLSRMRQIGCHDQRHVLSSQQLVMVRKDLLGYCSGKEKACLLSSQIW